MDYALLGEGMPLVFVEAKKVGGIDASSEEQLFNYATNKGVPLLILTDGNIWDFYLSMAEGIPSERKFFRIELERKDKIEEHSDFLLKHVKRSRVVSGAARVSAEDWLKTNKRRQRARESLPVVWSRLLEQPDERLRDCLLEEVEMDCGFKPDIEDVEEFLQSLSQPHLPTKESPSKEGARTRHRIKASTNSLGTKTRIVGFILNGERVQARTAKATLVEVLKRFAAKDPHFLERYSQETVGRKRRLVSRKREELYPDSLHLMSDHSVELGNGWWLGTNLSKAKVREHIGAACKVARVSGLVLIEE